MAAQPAMSPRERRLRALGVTPLRVRGADRGRTRGAAVSPAPAAPAAATASSADLPRGIRRLALQPAPEELHDPVIHAMYSALTDAVGKAGLQAVRVADAVSDASAAVLVFGNAPLPAGVPRERVLRADALALLHADRSRKRALWDMLLALGRGGEVR